MLRGAKERIIHGGKGGGVEAVDGGEGGEKGVSEACEGGRKGGRVGWMVNGEDRPSSYYPCLSFPPFPTHTYSFRRLSPPASYLVGCT